MNDLEEIYYA
jgi:hypothetical protein